ncbi:hypothetical protein BH23ACT5_BH23ACT5_08300 [soil metagenome]
MSTSASSVPSELALHLTIPAVESFVDLIRTAVGRVAQLAGFTFDGIEDLALAANEAAGLLLDLAPRSLEIEVRAPTADQRTAALVEMRAVGPQAEWPPPNLERDLRWQVLTAICEEVQVRADDHCGLVLVQGTR